MIWYLMLASFLLRTFQFIHQTSIKPLLHALYYMNRHKRLREKKKADLLSGSPVCNKLWHSGGELVTWPEDCVFGVWTYKKPVAFFVQSHVKIISILWRLTVLGIPLWINSVVSSEGIYPFHSQQWARSAGDLVDITIKFKIPFPKHLVCVGRKAGSKAFLSTWCSRRWPALIHTTHESTSQPWEGR